MSTRQQPLVSAVIPAHDAAPFVRDSIESVLAQTYPNIECIVVDDGSGDGTAEVVSGFGDCVTVVQSAQRGPGAARNLGVAAASGSLLAFLDADDLWMPAKIEAQVASLTRLGHGGLVYTGYFITDRMLQLIREVTASEPLESLRRALLLVGPGLASSSTSMVTREAFEAAGGYDETLPVSEDLDLLWRLSQTSTISAVSHPYALCRRHGSQRSRNLEHLEQCSVLVIARALATGLTDGPETSYGSVSAYLGWRRLLQGDVRAGLHHLRQAAATDWTRIAAVPAYALRRARHARHRSLAWPAGLPPLDLTPGLFSGVRES